MSATFDVKFTARDFEMMRDEILRFIRETKPTVWSDFADSSLGQVLVEMAALVGEVASFGQDQVAQELYLSTCRRYESAVRFARSVGYVPRLATAATCIVKATAVPDALITNGGVIAQFTALTTPDGRNYEVAGDPVEILPGVTDIRFVLTEGTSYSEEFTPSGIANQSVTTSNYVVADASWEVYVGDPADPDNLWDAVPNVLLVETNSHVYDVQVDGFGRLVVRFGDGVAGAIPNDTVTVKYRTCAGSSGNAPAGAVAGSLKVTLNNSAGVVSLPVVNRDVTASISGGSRSVSGENLGSTVANVTQTGTLSSPAIQAGTAVITIVLPAGGGTMVLQDTGVGAFLLTAHTTGYALSISSLNYETGAWTLTFTVALPAGGTRTANYFSIVPASDIATTIVGAAQGGEDRETLDELRVNVPAYIRSGDRLITLTDFNTQVLRAPGVALVYASPWVSSYAANFVRVNVWASERVEIYSEDSGGPVTSISAYYNRYAQMSSDAAQSVIDFMKPRTMVGTSGIVVRPTTFWVDLYLGTVRYDKRYAASDIRQSLLNASIRAFEGATGTCLYVADLYEELQEERGVRYFGVERLAVGFSVAAEAQGVTTGASTLTGTLSRTWIAAGQTSVVVPGTVLITVETGGAPLVLQDDGEGNLDYVSGSITGSGTINYWTGAWSATFLSAPPSNQAYYAAYDSVGDDRRRQQVVEFNETDGWPPPGTAAIYPKDIPPFLDGRPINAGLNPYALTTGDELRYPPVADLVQDVLLTVGARYDNTYLYNNEIYYDSVAIETAFPFFAINLRRVVFDLEGV